MTTETCPIVHSAGMMMSKSRCKILAHLWASPWTAFGLVAGLLALLTGGGVQRVGRVLEFHGGIIDRFCGGCRSPAGHRP